MGRHVEIDVLGWKLHILGTSWSLKALQRYKDKERYLMVCDIEWYICPQITPQYPKSQSSENEPGVRINNPETSGMFGHLTPQDHCSLKCT